MPHFQRILVIGAHPDDAEFHAGGLMLLQGRRGSRIGILSLTDGSAGHQRMDRSTLAPRRRREALRAARLLDADVHVWNEIDGELEASVALRNRLIVAVRQFAPDLIVTHRPFDYHPDHRATGQLVQDACYLLRVPNVEPEASVMAREPVVLGMCDFFERPAPFRADVVLPIDDVFTDVVRLLDCHESQVYEWLPHINGLTVEGEQLEWLAKFYGARPKRIAREFGTQCRYAEAFEISEYGRRITPAELATLLGVAPVTVESAQRDGPRR